MVVSMPLTSGKATQQQCRRADTTQPEVAHHPTTYSRYDENINWPTSVWYILYGACDGIRAPEGRGGPGKGSRYKGEPLQHGLNSSKVILHYVVADAVDSHDFGSAKLQLGAVDLSAKEFVESREACQDNGLIHPLHTSAMTCCGTVMTGPATLKTAKLCDLIMSMT